VGWLDIGCATIRVPLSLIDTRSCTLTDVHHASQDKSPYRIASHLFLLSISNVAANFKTVVSCGEDCHTHAVECLPRRRLSRPISAQPGVPEKGAKATVARNITAP
jgi:hypothetical protein